MLAVHETVKSLADDRDIPLKPGQEKRAFKRALSYLDLAAEIGIKNSSIHYHFKAKSDLALAMVERQRNATAESFSQLDHQIESPQDRVSAVIQHFKADIRDQKIYLCGMMADELALYFCDFQDWLSKQFSEMAHPNPPLAATR